jgi:hypothetical protein
MPFRQKSGSIRAAIAIFASAGLPGQSLARNLIAEAKVLRLSASVERTKWAGGSLKKTLSFMHRSVFQTTNLAYIANKKSIAGYNMYELVYGYF